MKLCFDKNLKGEECMFRKIKYGIQNLVKWFPVMWKDRDWDQRYLMEILSFKLAEMAKLHRKYGHFVNSDKYADQLEECSFLARKIADEDYALESGSDKLLEKMEMIFEDNGIINIAGLTKQEDEELAIMREQEEEFLERDINLLFENMKKNLRSWWN
jgi:hypothetical protein